jgi:hypothetical protein
MKRVEKARQNVLDESIRVIASVDVGRKNMAVFVYDALERRGLFWHNFDLRLSRTYDPRAYRQAVAEVLQKVPRADVYVVERQLPFATHNCYLEMAVHCIVTYGLRTPVVSACPKKIAEYFSLNLSSKHYKKRDAVHVCAQVLMCPRAAIRMNDPPLVARFLQESVDYGPRRKIASGKRTMKLDDLSDALLQTLYFVQTRTHYAQKNYTTAGYTHYTGRRSVVSSAAVVPADDDDVVDEDDEESDADDDDDDETEKKSERDDDWTDEILEHTFMDMPTHLSTPAKRRNASVN